MSLLQRNIAEVLPAVEEFEKRLASGPVTIYHGIDPSAPEIHIGHAVVLWKLREFQDAGHKVILLIGDFTGMIGDPSDRSAARVKLTKEQVLENAKSYKEQISKILRFEGENAVEIKFNSEWLSKLSFEEVVELASNLTVQQMLERDFFQRRITEEKPIYLHEFLYPLMQGYDSVAMDVDAEIGGTDQTFNMLVGRTLMKALKGKEKFVISVPLLEGLDGRKMSKSFNNYIGITESPEEIYGKAMSLEDDLIKRYFELATRLSEDEIKEVVSSSSPMEAKKRLAWEIANLYHGKTQADQAQEYFERVHQKRELPEEIEEIQVEEDVVNLSDFLVDQGIVSSKSEVRRLIDQGGIRINDEPVSNAELHIHKDGIVVKIGKRRFFRLKRS